MKNRKKQEKSEKQVKRNKSETFSCFIFVSNE